MTLGCENSSISDHIKDMCRLDDDCGGMTCCIEMSFKDIQRKLEYRINFDCKGVLAYSIENKKWPTNPVKSNGICFTRLLMFAYLNGNVNVLTVDVTQ